MSEVAVRCCLKWRGSEWVSCWKRAAAKLQKIGCFVNISSEDLQKADPDPFSPPRHVFHKAKEIEWVGIDWQTNLFFISFSLSLSLSRSDIQYDLFLMILSGWNYISSTHIVEVVLIPAHTKGIKSNYQNGLILRWKEKYAIYFVLLYHSVRRSSTSFLIFLFMWWYIATVSVIIIMCGLGIIRKAIFF